MNTAAIYSGISGKKDLAAINNPDEEANKFDSTGNPIAPKQQQHDKLQTDVARAQAKHSWINSTVTQELIKSLSDKYDLLIVEATNNACAYAESKNHDRVITKLVRAHEIQELMKHIVTINKPTPT